MYNHSFIWTYDFIKLSRIIFAIRNYNKQIAYECGFTNEEVIQLGLY